MATERYEVIIPERDRAHAETPQDALYAARMLLDDLDTHYGARRLHRATVIVTEDGIYSGRLTNQAREV